MDSMEKVAAPGAALADAVSEYVQSIDARFDGLNGLNGLRDPSLISSMIEKRIKDMDIVTESDLESAVESAVEDQLRNADLITEYDVDQKISDAVDDISSLSEDDVKSLAHEVFDDDVQDHDRRLEDLEAWMEEAKRELGFIKHLKAALDSLQIGRQRDEVRTEVERLQRLEV